ncbi:MAG: glycosyltransferase family 39 protein [Planctomycetota bacterium]|nr:glycosyltransferase family 39 protein [Planctomycetota bacterium]
MSAGPRKLAPLIVCIALGAVLRIPGLGSFPPPLTQDEASRGYDAWCLLETGEDRHGRRWPFFLESFGPGDYTAAFTTYLTMPFVAALGPTPTAIRLPDALLGVVTVALVFVFVRRRFDNTTACIAAAVLALDPWHISLCRTAHESGFTPFLLALALVGMQSAELLPERNPRPKGFAVSLRHRTAFGLMAGLALSLHAWAYPATRLFTPLFCLVFVVLYGRDYIGMLRRGDQRGPPIAAGIGLILGASPLWITALSAPHRIAARSGATLLFHQDLSALQIAGNFVSNWLSNLNPVFQFVQGQDVCGESIPQVGLHLAILAPIWLLGLIRIAATIRQSRQSQLLMAWMLLYPVPAAVCGDWNPHPLRTVAGVALFPIIAAVGAGVAMSALNKQKRPVRRIVGALAIAAFAANVGHFANAYFRKFIPIAELAYQTRLIRAFEYVAANAGEADFVLVTNIANQPYIYALLAEPISPDELKRSPMVAVDGPNGFHQVLAVGRYLFMPINTRRFPGTQERFDALLGRLPPEGDGFLIFESDSKAPGIESSPIVYRAEATSNPAINTPEPTYFVHKVRAAGNQRP